MVTFDSILEQALQLPVEDRSRLVTRLMESLDDADDDMEISPAWRAELQRRVEAVRNGIAGTIPHEEVMAQLRQIYMSIPSVTPASEYLLASDPEEIVREPAKKRLGL